MVTSRPRSRSGLFEIILIGWPSLRIEIQTLPNTKLSSNERASLGYYTRAALVATAKGQWVAIWRSKIGRKLRTPVRFRWTLVFPPGMRRLDTDGCADVLKPCVDAMVTAEIIPNDSPVYVVEQAYRSERGKAPMTVLEIWESPAPSRPGPGRKSKGEGIHTP